MKVDLKSVNCGIVNIDLEKIVLKYDQACPIFSALKKTQANTVSPKVNAILKNSLIEGKYLPFATISKFCLFLFKSKRGIKKMAFKAPQTMNVQLAPCQNPLTINIIKMFRTFINVPPLLPPNGM